MQKNLGLILASRLVSVMGTGIQAIAIPLFILEETGSASLMGLFYAATLIPGIVCTLPAGLAGDRNNRKHIILLMDALAALALMVMLGLHWLGLLGILTLFILQTFTSVVDVFYGTASSSLLPELFPGENLQKVMASKAMMDNIAQIGGPVLGGIIYAVGGLQAALLINLVSFVVSFGCELFIAYQWKKPERQEREKTGLKQYREVLAYIRTSQPVKASFLVIAVMNLLAVPFESICIPFLFKSVVGVGNQEFGFIQAALMAGMLLGNTALVSVLSRANKARLFKGSLLAQYFLTLLFTLLSLPTVYLLYKTFSLPFLLVAMVLLTVIGIGNGITNTMLMSALQTQVPGVMMGRFIGVIHLVCSILNPVGVLLVGIFLDFVPVFLVMTGLALLLLLVVLWFAGKPHVGVFAHQNEVLGEEPS